MILTLLWKIKNFSRLQAVMYTEKVVSQKWCKTEILLQYVTNRKWYAAYLTAAITMTFSIFEGVIPIFHIFLQSTKISTNKLLCNCLHICVTYYIFVIGWNINFKFSICWMSQPQMTNHPWKGIVTVQSSLNFWISCHISATGEDMHFKFGKVDW